MKIYKKEFYQCASQLINNTDLQKIETEHFIFIRVNDSITVKFKTINGLTGYFDLEEIKDKQTLQTILKTVEKELNKRLNPNIPKEGI